MSVMADRLRHRLVTLRNVLSGFCVHNQIVPWRIGSRNSNSAGRASEPQRSSGNAGNPELLTVESAEKGMSKRRTTRSKARLRIGYLISILLPSVLLTVMVVIWMEDGVQLLTKPSQERTDVDFDIRSRVVTTLLRYVVIVFDHPTENGSNTIHDEAIIVLLNDTDGCSCTNSSRHLVRFLSSCSQNTLLCGASESEGVDFVEQGGSVFIDSRICNNSKSNSLCTLDSSLNICDSFNAESRFSSALYNETSIMCVFENNNSDFVFIGCNTNNFQTPLSSSFQSLFSSLVLSAETKDLYMEVFLPLFVFLLHVASTILVLRFSAQRIRHQITSLELPVSTAESRWNRVKLEQKRSNQLLGQMLPCQIANKLKAGQAVDPETFDNVTVYFSDIPGFNAVALTVSPIDIVKLLNSVFR